MRRRIILLLALALFLVWETALADLKRGDRGDEVRELQTWLTETGVLQDKVDGIFGKKTEAAVKTLQGYFGQKKNGRADEKFLWELEDLWRAISGDGTESGADPEDLEDPKMYCVPEETEYCFRHEEAGWVESFLNRKGRKPPRETQILLMERACRIWFEQTEAMYDIWEENLPADKDHIAREQKQIYLDAYSEVSGDLADRYGEKDRVKELTERLNWLREMGVQECYDLYGRTEPN